MRGAAAMTSHILGVCKTDPDDRDGRHEHQDDKGQRKFSAVVE